MSESKRRHSLQRASSVRAGAEPPTPTVLISKYAERSPGTSIVDTLLPLLMTFSRSEHALAVRFSAESRIVTCVGFGESAQKRLLSGGKKSLQRWLSSLNVRLEQSGRIFDAEPPSTVPDELPRLRSLYACRLASNVGLLLLSPLGLSAQNLELMEPTLCVAEQLLREEQQQQSTLASLVQLGRALDRQGEALLYVSLRSLSIKQTSASAPSLLGCEAAELIGKKLHRIFDKEKASLKEFLNNHVQQPESPSLVEEAEAKCWRLLGGELEVLVSCPGRATVKHSDCALLLLRKVDSYEKRVREAEQKSKNKTEFMAHLGHEIRTPLNCILSTVPLLASSSLSEEQKRCVQIVQQSSFDMMMIVGDFLDMARLDSNKMRLHESEISLVELLEFVQRSLRPSAEAKQLQLTHRLDTSVPAKVFADFSRLRQVLQNLVGNAIKFTRSGSIHVSASAKHHADHHRISISVTDTGIGIAQENLKLIFKSFRQVDESTTQESGGTGLGLAISRKLVKLMDHGSITVDSQLGAGSTFTVHFNSPILDNELLLKRHSAILAQKRVLIVDDIANNRISLFSQLEQWGLQPTTAASAEDAINANLSGRAEEPFDLGIIDLRMPMMDGVGLASWIRRKGFTFPLILLSSSPEESENLNAEEKAIFKFSLVRPVPQRRMLAAVMSALGAADRTLDLIINERPQSANAGTGRAGSIAAPERHRLSRLPAEVRATRILVAEDTAMNQRVIEILLRRLGYSHLDIVGNGQAVLDACAQPSAHYDVILMDIRMPVMNGFEASKQLSNTYAQRRLTRPKVLALTSMASEDVLAWCAKGYIDDLLNKPIDINLLRDKLDRLLGDADQKRRLSTPM